jgi:hypothetical protein
MKSRKPKVEILSIRHIRWMRRSKKTLTRITCLRKSNEIFELIIEENWKTVLFHSLQNPKRRVRAQK